MSDLDNLRDSVRDSKYAEGQSNKWLYGFLLAFPLLGLGGGFAFKSLNNQNYNGQDFAQILDVPASTNSTDGAKAPKVPASLSQNKTFLKMAKTTSDDPFVLASDQNRTYAMVHGKLEACLKKNENQKFARLQESYRRRNKSAYDKNQKIIAARSQEQFDKQKKFAQKLNNSNKAQQVATVLAAKSTGAFDQHAAVMMSSFGGLSGGYSSRSVSADECTNLSKEVATGKKNITAIKK